MGPIRPNSPYRTRPGTTKQREAEGHREGDDDVGHDEVSPGQGPQDLAEPPVASGQVLLGNAFVEESGEGDRARTSATATAIARRQEHDRERDRAVLRVALEEDLDRRGHHRWQREEDERHARDAPKALAQHAQRVGPDPARGEVALAELVRAELVRAGGSHRGMVACGRVRIAAE